MFSVTFKNLHPNVLIIVNIFKIEIICLLPINNLEVTVTFLCTFENIILVRYKVTCLPIKINFPVLY